MAKPPILELRGLSLRFGGLTVLDELDLEVKEGEIVSVIGPNGAGKTTLFNVVTGIYGPWPGISSSTANRSSAWRRTRSIAAASRARSRRCGCS